LIATVCRFPAADFFGEWKGSEALSPDVEIGFVGGGKMAEALVRGLLRAKLCRTEQLIVSDVLEQRRRYFQDVLNVRSTPENAEVADFARVLVLAVKPHVVVTPVLRELAPSLQRQHLVVSIAAGVPLRILESALPEGQRVVRVMPNTPALVGEMAAGYSLGRHATEEDGKLVAQILGAAGRAFELDEKLLDAVTGLSGSGPAYVCLIIEALSDGGVKMGLPRDVATALACQTLLGTAKMIVETKKHPGELKDMVTSPGGTTIEAIHELEKGGLRAALIRAVEAATLKSQQLGKAAGDH